MSETEFSKRRVARLTVALAAIVVAGVIPASAGPGSGNCEGNGGVNGHNDDSTYDTRHMGDINPTNVSIVETDLEAAAPTAGIGGLDISLEGDVAAAPVDGDRLNAEAAHRIATGRGVVVAVLDGGFDTRHPDIAGNVIREFDAFDEGEHATDRGNGVDDDGDGVVDRGVGHGTFVAGMVLRAAPDAEIVAIRVRDDEGNGPNAVLRAGIDYAIEAGADVINLSLSDSQTMDKGLNYALWRAKRRGIVLVASAGNAGNDSLSGLAYDCDLAVGAVDALDRVAEFSNFIDEPSSAPCLVFAPGVDLRGPMFTIGFDDDERDDHESDDYERDDHESDDEDEFAGAVYGTWSGTSFSAGTISGAVALVRERHPEWSRHDVRSAVAASVQPVSTADGRVLEHAGRIDLLQAVTR